MQRIFLADDINTPPRDEIDELFDRLQPIKPPPSLIQRILTSISRLPRPTLPSEPWDEENILDNLVIRKDKLPPS